MFMEHCVHIASCSAPSMDLHSNMKITCMYSSGSASTLI